MHQSNSVYALINFTYNMFTEINLHEQGIQDVRMLRQGDLGKPHVFFLTLVFIAIKLVILHGVFY